MDCVVAELLQMYENDTPPDGKAVNTVLFPLQIVVVPEILTVGLAFTLIA
jgi:hypothetical protein